MESRDPAGPAVTTEEVLDAKAIDGLRQLEAATGTPLIDELTQTFRADTPKRIAELREAVRAGDLDTVKRGAHRLRGSAGALGATRLFATATALEDAADRGALDGCGPLVDRLKEEAARAIEALVRLERPT